MGQYAVHENPGRSKPTVPFLLDVQAELLSELDTRMAVPLYRLAAAKPMAISKLAPIVRFKGMNLVVMVTEMAGVPRRTLGKVVGDLAASRAEILGAIDLVLTGF